MNKRVLAILSLIVVLALALTACGATSSSGGTTVKKIGFSTDVGRIDDKSFNQAGWEGVQAAGTELKAEVKYVVTTDAKDYLKNIQQFADAGYDVIVTSGLTYLAPFS